GGGRVSLTADEPIADHGASQVGMASQVSVPQRPPDDPVLFGEWLRPHLRQMAYLVARLAPHADRDDVVQEALTRAWLKRHLLDRGGGTERRWLLATAADQAAKAGSRNLRRPTEPLGPDPLVSHDPASAAVGTAEASAGRVDVDRALARLSRRQRLA